MDSDDWHKAHGLAPAGTAAYSEVKSSASLSEKLKKTLVEVEQARIKGIEAKANADMEVIRRSRNDLEDWLEHTRVDLVAQIERGRVPLKKVKDYNRRSWLQEAQRGVAVNFDLWSKFKQFWTNEGLEIVIEDAHDGMGMECWINLTVKVIDTSQSNAKPSSATHGLKFDLDVGEYRG